MCWSKHEREQWEHERLEREREVERLRWISTTEPNAEELIGFGNRIDMAAAGTGIAGQSKVYVHFTSNNVFGIFNGTSQPDQNNTLVGFSY